MKMEILLESTSNKLMVGIRRALFMLEILSRRFFLKLNLSDHSAIFLAVATGSGKLFCQWELLDAPAAIKFPE
nr:hypothetical protein [Tanacetum cinerariifolium]